MRWRYGGWVDEKLRLHSVGLPVAQCDAALLGIYVQDHNPYFLAPVDAFAGIRDDSSRQLRDVHQPLNAGRQLHKRTEIRDPRHPALHRCEFRPTKRRPHPRIVPHTLDRQADPVPRNVHAQHPNLHHLILADATILHSTQDEADRLVAELMGVYAEDGWVLKAARPDRWYLKPPQVPDIQTAPLPTVVGRDVHAYLPQGKDAKAWHTILNEIQILLHTAPVNAERERQGQLPINSVWFWGGGPLPELKHVQWAKIWSTEPVSLALARLSETACAPVPAQAQEWLDQVDVPGEHLFVMDEGRGAVQYGDSERWVRFIQTLETEWIMPLLLALKKGRIRSLTVYTESVPGFALTAKHLRRWWRRRRSLLGYR